MASSSSRTSSSELLQIDNSQQQILAEIQDVFEGFLILKSVNPNQNPGVVIRYLEKIFGDGPGTFQLECETLMKIHRVFQVYKRFSRLVPEEAPVILIENLANIFKLEQSLSENQQLSIENEKETREISQEGQVLLSRGQDQGQGEGSVTNFSIAGTSKSTLNSNRVEIQVSQCKFCLRPFPNEYFLKKHELNFCGLKRPPSPNIRIVSVKSLSKSSVINSSPASIVSSPASTLLLQPQDPRTQTPASSISSPKSKQKSPVVSTSSPSPSKSEAVAKWLQVQKGKEDEKSTKSVSSSSSSSAGGFFADFPDSDADSETSIACTTVTSASDPLSLAVKNGGNGEDGQQRFPDEIEKIEKEDAGLSFDCAYCDKKYVNLRGLNVHMKVHTGDYDFQCERCPKQFAYPSQLKIHMRVHTKKFPCRISECTKTFHTKGRRNRHETLHKNEIEANESNSNPNSRQNPLETKGMKLKPKSNGNLEKLLRKLKKSRRILTKKIPSRITKFRQLKTKTKTSERPREKTYECPVCNKQMASAQTLGCHLRAQHSNRPFPCRFCSKSFKYSSNRSSHENIHKIQERKKPEGSENDQNQRKSGNEHFGTFTCRFENCTFKTYDQRILAHHFCQEHTQELLSNPANQI